MSANAIEMVLWRICYDANDGALFRSDPSVLFDRFGLAPVERVPIAAGDVRALLELGVNDMLIYSFFQFLNGRGAAATYLQLMNA